MRFFALLLLTLSSALPAAANPIASFRGEPAVIVEFTVKVDGTADLSTIRIIESSGDPKLDAKAWEEVNRMRFTPATENGEPVEVQHKLRIVFGDATGSPGMTAETAVLAPPPDTILLSPEKPCKGLPVLTQEGPRTLINFTVTGQPETLRLAKAKLVAAGVPDAAIEASKTHDRLTVALGSDIRPSRLLTAYHGLEDGATKLIPHLYPIDVLIDGGCVAHNIHFQSLPAPPADIPLNSF